MYRFPPVILFFLALVHTAVPSMGEEVYLEPDVFIEECLGASASQEVVWLTKDLKQELADILGRPFKGLRVRYWKNGDSTAWILEEIGKVELITAGFHVTDDSMQRMEVLIYRESHGWEVRYPFFSRQFRGLQLDNKMRLSKNIDGISGATLSVDAITRLSRAALYLHGKVASD
ncbi:MAG: FMN-binding protein [Puniceicoccaceae bacterium]